MNLFPYFRVPLYLLCRWPLVSLSLFSTVPRITDFLELKNKLLDYQIHLVTSQNGIWRQQVLCQGSQSDSMSGLGLDPTTVIPGLGSDFFLSFCSFSSGILFKNIPHLGYQPGKHDSGVALPVHKMTCFRVVSSLRKSPTSRIMTRVKNGWSQYWKINTCFTLYLKDHPRHLKHTCEDSAPPGSLRTRDKELGDQHCHHSHVGTFSHMMHIHLCGWKKKCNDHSSICANWGSRIRVAWPGFGVTRIEWGLSCLVRDSGWKISSSFQGWPQWEQPLPSTSHSLTPQFERELGWTNCESQHDLLLLPDKKPYK